MIDKLQNELKNLEDEFNNQLAITKEVEVSIQNKIRNAQTILSALTDTSVEKLPNLLDLLVNTRKAIDKFKEATDKEEEFVEFDPAIKKHLVRCYERAAAQVSLS